MRCSDFSVGSILASYRNMLTCKQARRRVRQMDSESQLEVNETKKNPENIYHQLLQHLLHHLFTTKRIVLVHAVFLKISRDIGKRLVP